MRDPEIPQDSSCRPRSSSRAEAVFSSKMTQPVVESQVDNIVLKNKNTERDKALPLLAVDHVGFDPNSPEAKAVLRKIDLRVMPILLVVYTLMLVDKNSISYANIMGIKEDTHLSASNYSWLGSIVYFGYLAGEIPVSIAMQRVPLAKFFSIMTVAWGSIMLFHAACHTFNGLVAVRFLLGVVEVCAAPIVIYILSSWYSREEQTSRVAIWYSASGMGQVFGGFFAFCIYQAPAGFRWQALFLFEGALTICVGVYMFFCLAASPTDAKWLSNDEKRIALERCRGNKTGTEVWKFDKSQLWEALHDPRLYLVFLYQFSTGLPSGGLSVFGPTIISAFGFTKEQSTLLSMAPGAAAIVGSILVIYVAKWSSRTLAALFTLVISCIGVVMMFTIPTKHAAARYGGYILTLQFPVSVLFVINFMTAGVGGSTKKVVFTVAFQLGYIAGNIVGPQTYRPSDAPNYYIAKFTMLGFLIFCILLISSFGGIHWYWNRIRDLRDRSDRQNGIVHVVLENEEFLDLTDSQIRSFRYPI